MTAVLTSCYMCAEQATSTEHAPAKCFFPEQKDLPGQDLRRNLITVPSCETHNTARAKDDEYVMSLCVTYFDTNAIARSQFATKIMRALQRSPAFVKTLFGPSQRATVNGQESLAVQIDDARFERVMNNTVRALFYHHTRDKLTRTVRINSPSFVSADAELNAAYLRIRSIATPFFAPLPRYGENPQVFYYQISPGAGSREGVARLVFFEGFEVFAAWGPIVDAQCAV